MSHFECVFAQAGGKVLSWSCCAVFSVLLLFYSQSGNAALVELLIEVSRFSRLLVHPLDED